tara:strand:- start:901 stop:1101 length:201 start_codon:yes stop_codon:yes gene_type:complete
MGEGLYLWGVDGNGRAHIALKTDRAVLFSMIDGGGFIGVSIIEEQDKQNKIKLNPNNPLHVTSHNI